MSLSSGKLYKDWGMRIRTDKNKDIVDAILHFNYRERRFELTEGIRPTIFRGGFIVGKALKEVLTQHEVSHALDLAEGKVRVPMRGMFIDDEEKPSQVTAILTMEKSAWRRTFEGFTYVPVSWLEYAQECLNSYYEAKYKYYNLFPALAGVE